MEDNIGLPTVDQYYACLVDEHIRSMMAAKASKIPVAYYEQLLDLYDMLSPFFPDAAALDKQLSPLLNEINTLAVNNNFVWQEGPKGNIQVFQKMFYLLRFFERAIYKGMRRSNMITSPGVEHLNE